MKITEQDIDRIIKKINKFEFFFIPVQIQPIRPILGRLYAVYALMRCVKLFKFSFDGYKFYRLTIPKLERCVK